MNPTTTLSRVTHALAERDGSNINITRVREKLCDQAGGLIREWSRNAGTPSNDVETILEEGRLADLAAEAERREKRNAAAEQIAGHIAGNIAAHTSAPDLAHRTITVRDSASGLAYRIRVPIDALTLLSHDEREAAHAAAGRPFVKRAA